MAYQAGLEENSTVSLREVAVWLPLLNKSAKLYSCSLPGSTVMGNASVTYSLLGSTGITCCSPSLKFSLSATSRQPSKSYRSVAVKANCTATLCLASVANGCFCVATTSFVNGLNQVSVTTPASARSVRLSTVAANTVWSPTRTKRGKLGVNIKSLLVTTSSSSSASNISFVCAYPLKFHVVRLSGMVKLNTTSPFSLVSNCG